jgi:hypothetical protein
VYVHVTKAGIDPPLNWKVYGPAPVKLRVPTSHPPADTSPAGDLVKSGTAAGLRPAGSSSENATPVITYPPGFCTEMLTTENSPRTILLLINSFAATGLVKKNKNQ